MMNYLVLPSDPINTLITQAAMLSWVSMMFTYGKWQPIPSSMIT